MDYYRLKLTKSKLKAISGTSSLMSGFAMVAMVELGLDYDSYFESIEKNGKINSQAFLLNITQYANITNVLDANITNVLEPIGDANKFTRRLIPEFIFISYVLVTCLLVGIHMLALMIAICILPQVDATTEQMEFERNLRKFEKKHLSNKIGSLVSEDEENNLASTLFNSNVSAYPHRNFHNFVEMAWLASTVLGILLFIIEIMLVCFIKFYPISILASVTGACVMFPILLIFIYFTIVFYKKLAEHKLYVTKQFFNHVDRNLDPLHEHVV